MKRIILTLAISLFLFGFVQSQNTTNNCYRFIEVTGSVESELEPDEIKFIIGIEEYWKEEFKNMKPEKYKNKVSIIEIQQNLLTDLNKIGITQDKITVNEIGNYYRNKGEEFLISKQIVLSLPDFKKVDDIIKNIDIKGISYMNIGELKSSKLAEVRKKLKIEALQVAKEKAEYLCQTLKKKITDVISIEEVNNDNNIWWRAQAVASNASMDAGGSNDFSNGRKIKLRYEMKVRFEIL